MKEVLSSTLYKIVLQKIDPIKNKLDPFSRIYNQRTSLPRPQVESLLEKKYASSTTKKDNWGRPFVLLTIGTTNCGHTLI